MAQDSFVRTIEKQIANEQEKLDGYQLAAEKIRRLRAVLELYAPKREHPARAARETAEDTARQSMKNALASDRSIATDDPIPPVSKERLMAGR